MTATYWEIGRRTVQSEQQGEALGGIRPATWWNSLRKTSADNLAEWFGNANI
jgi:hypothetical protein